MDSRFHGNDAGMSLTFVTIAIVGAATEARPAPTAMAQICEALG